MFLSPRRAGDRTTATSLTASIPFLSSSRSFFQPVKRTAVKTCFPLSSSFIFFVTLARTYLRLNQVTRSRRPSRFRLSRHLTEEVAGAKGPGASSLVKNWPETIQRTTRSFLRYLFHSSPLPALLVSTTVSFLPFYTYPDDVSPSLPAMSQRMSWSGISRRAANDVTSTRDTRRYHRTWRIFVMDQGIVYGLET